jgi:hypothetical protein
MPIRFYRRFRAGPFRINVGKRRVSYSVGTRGLWFTAGRRHIRTTLSLPGTGLSLYQVHKRNNAPAAVSVARNQAQPLTLPASSADWHHRIDALEVLIVLVPDLDIWGRGWGWDRGLHGRIGQIERVHALQIVADSGCAKWHGSIDPRADPHRTPAFDITAELGRISIAARMLPFLSRFSRSSSRCDRVSLMDSGRVLATDTPVA